MSKSTIRGSSAPQRGFVKRTESLAAFFQRLGRVIYGADWRYPSANATTVGNKQIGSPDEMADIVRGQIIAGVQTGRVKLIQSFSLEALQPKAPPETDAPASMPKRRAPIEEDEEARWAFLPALWAGDLDVDWEESVARVACSDIHDGQRNSNLLDRYENPNRPIAVHLIVDDPDASIRKLIDYSELPPDDWFIKYNKYTNIVTRECVAVAWRAAAVIPLSIEHGIRERLVSEMSEYAGRCGFEISEEALRNIARKLVKQWRERDLLARIFINSSRNK